VHRAVIKTDLCRRGIRERGIYSASSGARLSAPPFGRFHWPETASATARLRHRYPRLQSEPPTGRRYHTTTRPQTNKVRYSTLSPVSSGMGDRILTGIPPRHVTKPARSTQPCIPPGSLNRVPALIGWGKGGMVTSAAWQVTLYDPIWEMSSRIAVTPVRHVCEPLIAPSSLR